MTVCDCEHRCVTVCVCVTGSLCMRGRVPQGRMDLESAQAACLPRNRSVGADQCLGNPGCVGVIAGPLTSCAICSSETYHLSKHCSRGSRPQTRFLSGPLPLICTLHGDMTLNCPLWLRPPDEASLSATVGDHSAVRAPAMSPRPHPGRGPWQEGPAEPKRTEWGATPPPGLRVGPGGEPAVRGSDRSMC